MIDPIQKELKRTEKMEKSEKSAKQRQSAASLMQESNDGQERFRAC